MKIKFNSDDNLPLNKVRKLDNLTIVVRSFFQEVSKYHTQVFLVECLYELKMLEHDRRKISEGIDINKTNASKECDICHYWYLLDKGFKFGPYLCNGCYDLIQKAMSFNDAPIASVIGSEYRIRF